MPPLAIVQVPRSSMSANGGFFDPQRIRLETLQVGVACYSTDFGEDVGKTDEGSCVPGFLRALVAGAQQKMRAGGVWVSHPPGLG